MLAIPGRGEVSGGERVEVRAGERGKILVEGGDGLLPPITELMVRLEHWV